MSDLMSEQLDAYLSRLDHGATAVDLAVMMAFAVGMLDDE